MSLLRAARPDDEPALLALNLEAEAVLSPLDAPGLRHLVEQADQCLVVEREGVIAAFLLALGPGADYASENYRWFAARFDDFLYVDRVVVAPAWRGRGLGRMLYQALFRRATAIGVARVTCEYDVEPPNPPSAGFHARLGFTEIGRRRICGATKQVSLQAAVVPPA